MSEDEFLPKLGERVPDFKAQTTKGVIRFYDILRQGFWVLLFSHPAPFTPVCTSEFIAFAQNYNEFEKRGVFLLGLAVGTLESQLAWIRSIKESFGIDIPFPVIADYNMRISTMFNMYHPKERELGTIRATFIIDNKGIIRYISYYPNEIGRSIDELLRVIDALKYSLQYKVLIPANWKPGDKALAKLPENINEIEARMRNSDYECLDWYYCYIIRRKECGK